MKNRGPALIHILDELADERRRQIEHEGYTLEHDDGQLGQLAMAAAGHALASIGAAPAIVAAVWPFEGMQPAPKLPRRHLVIAGALIVAELERRDRRAALESAGGTPQVSGAPVAGALDRAPGGIEKCRLCNGDGRDYDAVRDPRGYGDCGRCNGTGNEVT